MRPLHLPLLVLLLLSGGCAERRSQIADSFPFYNHPRIHTVHRIAVCPLFRADGVGRSASSVDRAMPAAWRELGLFEVLVLDETERDGFFPIDPLRRGSIGADSLRRLGAALNVDAVLIGRIEQFSGYDPVAMGLECTLVDCRDATVLWAGSGHFDSQRLDVQNDLRAWYRAVVGDANQAIAGWRTALHSPSLFARYVCDRLAHTVQGAPTIKDRNTSLFARRR